MLYFLLLCSYLCNSFPLHLNAKMLHLCEHFFPKGLKPWKYDVTVLHRSYFWVHLSVSRETISLWSDVGVVATFSLNRILWCTITMDEKHFSPHIIIKRRGMKTVKAFFWESQTPPTDSLSHSVVHVLNCERNAGMLFCISAVRNLMLFVAVYSTLQL